MKQAMLPLSLFVFATPFSLRSRAWTTVKKQDTTREHEALKGATPLSLDPGHLREHSGEPLLRLRESMPTLQKANI
jgi:hypothetical protein